MPGDAHVFTTDILLTKFTLHPWPRIMDSAKRKKTLAGSQAAHMQSLAHGMKVGGTWPAAQLQSQASPFDGWRAAAHGLPKCSLHGAAA